MAVASAVFLGEQTLLIQCMESWRGRGGGIALVVGADAAILRWCEEHDVPLASPEEDWQARLPPDFDYLFSITNLRLLPDAVLRRPRRAAINFHDGPLPRYAGLNVPAWALLAGETSHGVSFHLMTHGLDAGDIVAERRFAIEDGETAFTLNAKCYEAAQELFPSLAEALFRDELPRTPQDRAQRGYYALARRPEAAATLDPRRPAAELERLVRAMDYGPYLCPLAYPKLLLPGSQLVVVREAVATARTGPAGAVLDVSTETLVLGCAEGSLEIRQLADLGGQRLSPEGLLRGLGLKPGDLLPSLDDAGRAAISVRNEACARHEGYWRRRLRRLEPIEVPYARTLRERDRSAREHRWQALPAACTGRDEAWLFAGIALYLSRLGGKSAFDLALQSAQLALEAPQPAHYFSAVVPVALDLQAGMRFDALADACAATLEALQQRGGFAADLYLRDPELHHAPRCELMPVAVLQRCPANAPAELAHIGAELVLGIDAGGNRIGWWYRASSYDTDSIERMQRQLAGLLERLVADPGTRLADCSILDAADRSRIFGQWNATASDYDARECVHHLFEQQVRRTPEAPALAFHAEQLSYEELNARANRLAHHLLASGASKERPVGVLVDRGTELIVTLLAVLKTGSHYLPLDPVYPRERLAWMVEDSGAALVVTHDHYRDFIRGDRVRLLPLESEREAIARCPATDPGLDVDPAQLAYLIYTSGSTGRPKGVMVEHRNVVAFFAGMDQRLEPAPGVWLAVTSISFDISVLEIFWTLARGFELVLYADEKRQKSALQKAVTRRPERSIDFSLFYWNVASEESLHETDKYRLLLESARFADRHRFKALWTPERHFAAFGGLYPNPSVTSAALATITEHVQLRAGSCVAPLHSPIRIAEDWAMVDNLSGGRVALAFASGWAPPDFAIRPEAFANAKQVMFDTLATVRALWRGERIEFPGPGGKPVAVRTLPRPIQAELPVWITTAGNSESFRKAAELGANVLTHLLGQSFEDVGEKVRIYREAWRAAGHAGEGTVTLMLHTFVGTSIDEVERHVREPMKAYLKSAMFLVKDAAWNFPTFRKMSDETGKTLDEFFATIAAQDLDDLLEFAFQRYFRTSGLFGTVEDCLGIVDSCKGIDIDEIACLIDFGVDTDVVLRHLPLLEELRSRSVAQAAPESADRHDIGTLLLRHGVTHLQCTPSMAAMLAADAPSRRGLAALRQLMVGGEAFPEALARELRSVVGGRITNMYGPTETTIWSSTGEVGGEDNVSIGTPIANTRIYVVDENLQALPDGVPGELVIAGDGVVRGYHARPDLTAERFVPDRFSEAPGARMYRTGDLARFEPDGRIRYLGRIDHQVKIRGYRVELGEIEALLRADASVREAVVLLREDTPGDQRLVAYVRPAPHAAIDAGRLRAALGSQLPEFMVPAALVELTAMPLTPNGKIDRKALPPPRAERRPGAAALVAPGNEYEVLVAEIWQRALDLPTVGVRENFFDIGGHSLLVIRVLKELREHPRITRPVQMTDLFRYTTIAALAQFLAGEDGGSARGSEAGQSRAAARKAAMARRRR